jgi:hypothetical protein
MNEKMLAKQLQSLQDTTITITVDFKGRVLAWANRKSAVTWNAMARVLIVATRNFNKYQRRVLSFNNRTVISMIKLMLTCHRWLGREPKQQSIKTSC